MQVIVDVVDSTTHEAILEGALVILRMTVVRLAFSLFQTVLGVEWTLQCAGWGRISVLLFERVDELVGIEFHLLLLLLFGFFTLKTEKKESRVTIFSLDGGLYVHAFGSHGSLLMMKFHPLFLTSAFDHEVRMSLVVLFFVA